MEVSIKEILSSNIILKISSLIIGFLLWHLLSQSQYYTMQLDIPLSFYSVDKQYSIEAPETINITLSGKRSHLSVIDMNNLAIHIDGQQLHLEQNMIAIDTQHLFLPKTIKLLHYSPSTIVITVNEKKDTLQQK